MGVPGQGPRKGGYIRQVSVGLAGRSGYQPTVLE